MRYILAATLAFFLASHVRAMETEFIDDSASEQDDSSTEDEEDGFVIIAKDDFVIIEEPLLTRCKKTETELRTRKEKISTRLQGNILQIFDNTETDSAQRITDVAKELYVNTAEYLLILNTKKYASDLQKLTGIISIIESPQGIQAKTMNGTEITIMEEAMAELERTYASLSINREDQLKKEFDTLLLSEKPISYQAFETLIARQDEDNKKLEASIQEMRIFLEDDKQ